MQMVHQHMFNKLKNKLNKKGLSLIEVIIVMAITGFTLVALLNLATRDLLIEKLNEQQDIANYISVSQLEEFDSIKTSNPGCISSIATNYSFSQFNNQNYFICSNSFSYWGHFPIVACTQAGQTWYIYNQINPNLYMNVSYQGNKYDCTNGASSYSERFFLNGVVDTASGVNMDFESDVKWTSITKFTNSIALREEYVY